MRDAAELVHLGNVRALIAATLLALGCAGHAGAQHQPAILKDRALPPGAPNIGAPPAEVMRQRAVSIDLQSLSSLRGGQPFIFNLFLDTSLPAVIDGYRQSATDTLHWEGRIDGHLNSSFHMVLHKGALAALIRVPGLGDFRIRSTGDTGQVAEEIDGSKFPPCGLRPDMPLPAVPPRDGLAAAPEVGPTTCIDFLDVMVLYTAEARDLEGGAAAIAALAILAIDETNSAFTNSEIGLRARLVHVQEIDYVESGSFFTELQRLTDPVDGFMDEAHTLRNEFGADLVDLFISHTQGGTICGIAHLMGPPPSTAFENMGFSVCNTGCVAGGYTFPHELGHNMGCHHDRDNIGTSQPAFAYSYGYRYLGNTGQVYRTVMAYPQGIRIPYFSNPNLEYQGQPIGLPDGHTNQNGEPDSADNARTINETKDIVRAFRPAVVPNTELPMSWLEPGWLRPEDVMPGDRFGTSVAIDGNLMIIGAYTADTELVPDRGAAYVYRYDETMETWTLEAKLLAADGTMNDRFGIAVDIIDDGAGGGYAIVGAYLEDDGGRDSGAAYTFIRSQQGWSQQAKLLAMDMAPGDLFGRSVSIERTGADVTALIGAYLDDDNGLNTGSAYVFRSNLNGPWTQITKLHADDAQPQDNFGFIVDLEVAPLGGHLVAAVSAWKDDVGAVVDAGSAYVFEENDEGLWIQQAKLTAINGGANDQFGYSLDMQVLAVAKEDVTTVVVGAWTFDGPAANTGAAYVFSDAVGAWAQESRLTSLQPDMDARVGSSVAISGSAAIVGAYLNDLDGAPEAGAAYVFRRSGTGWFQEARIVAPDAAQDDGFGFSVALANNRSFIGSWEDDGEMLTDAGTLYISDAVAGLDCNMNGVPDFCDIQSGTSQDVNMNGIPDECEAPACAGDITLDGEVSVNDMLAVISGWGACPVPPTPCPADIDPSPGGNGVVDINDLLVVISTWGPCPAP